MIQRFLLSFALCFLLPLMASAQSEEPINYDLWNSVAGRAETAVDTGAGSNSVFETLRNRIVDFRTKFADARLENKERIETTQAQLSALGDVPENGSEPADIANQRRELEANLAELQAPVQVADAAYSRANGLIGEIDQIIRERQTQRLLSLGPSPLNPANWGDALGDLATISGDLRGERRLFSDEAARRTLKESAPLVLILLAISAVLLARGRHWVIVFGEYLRALGGRGTGVWSFILSVFRVLVPLFGVLMFSFALLSTGMLGLRGTQLVSSLPVWGAMLLGTHWLSERVFPRQDDEPLIPLAIDRRREARLYLSLLAVVFVLLSLLDQLLSFGAVSEVTAPLLTFPLVVVAGVLLFRIGQILRNSSEVIEDENGVQRRTTFSRILRLIGLGVIVVSIVGPAMAAIGYGQAGTALVFPMALSLGLLGLVLVLQRFFADIYCWISGQGVAGREALVPVLIGFALLVIATPMLALVWGARVADLTELWSAFSQGFAVGETRISPGDFIAFAVIFSVGYMVTRLLQGALRNNVFPKTTIDKGAQNAIVSGLGYIGIFFAALIAITGAGIDLSSLAIVAGALSVGIGFGLQNIVSNFVSGIILLIERPISEGDWIEVGGKHGYVRAISVRSTRIETFDRTDVIVPNADLVSGTVTNYTRGNTVGRLIMQVGVAYGTDTKKVDAILREIAEAQPMVLANPAPFILFSGFGADSLDFELRMILRDVNWSLSVKNEVNHQIMARFTEEGIEIPFAQRDLWLRNPETLKGE